MVGGGSSAMDEAAAVLRNPASTPAERRAAQLARAAAMLDHARTLGGRSARASEQAALFGPDIITCCELAIKDCNAVLQVDSACEAALLLRPQLAALSLPHLVKEFVLEGLRYFPCHAELLALAQQHSTPAAHFAASRRAVLASRASEDSPLPPSEVAPAATAEAPAGSEPAAAEANEAKAEPASADDDALPTSDTAATRGNAGTDGGDINHEKDATAGADDDDDADAESSSVPKETLWGELQCPLCMRLLLEPVTTPCGHTFCRACLQISLDHAVSAATTSMGRQCCPMCRTALHMSVGSHPATTMLQRLLDVFFREELAQRLAEERSANQNSSASGGPPAQHVDPATPGSSASTRSNCSAAGSAAQPPTAPTAAAPAAPTEIAALPIFVCNSLVPGIQTELNIFEPRYRLMMRRAMQGSLQFGMVTHTRAAPGFATCGCLVRIVDSTVQPDGRLHMAILGIDRFRIVSHWEVDGYRVARVTIVRDVGDDLSDRELELAEGLLRLFVGSIETRTQRRVRCPFAAPAATGATAAVRREWVERVSVWLLPYVVDGWESDAILGATSSRERVPMVLPGGFQFPSDLDACDEEEAP